jgi:hypothetical protein
VSSSSVLQPLVGFGFLISFHVGPKYYSDDQIKKNEIGGACGTYGGQERCIHYFGGETRGKETT